MKIKKSLLAKYNHPDVLGMISLYPKRGEVYSSATSGVASYAKNTASHISRNVVVLANIIDKPEVYEEGNVLVIRCFQPGKILLWQDIFKRLKQFSQVRNILIQFDFSIYASLLASALILPFLFLLKTLGYEVSVVSHHVVLDVKKLSGHMGLGKDLFSLFKAFIFNHSFYLFYLFLGLLVAKIIVLEQGLKTRLAKIVKKERIQVIPHVVDDGLEPISKSRARRKLGIGPRENLVLFFGFVNWFKGADFFVKSFTQKSQFAGKKTRFIIAGGESPTLAGKRYYQKYFNQVVKEVKKSKNITLTGYVPQDQIKLYFSAADLVVFPYRDFMCASGVLSLIFSYQRPFIVSENLSSMLKGKDFDYAFKTVDLDKKDLIFRLDKKSLFKLTNKVLANGVKAKMIALAKIMQQQRCLKSNAYLYERVLFSPLESLKKALRLSYTYSYEG